MSLCRGQVERFDLGDLRLELRIQILNNTSVRNKMYDFEFKAFRILYFLSELLELFYECILNACYVCL